MTTYNARGTQQIEDNTGNQVAQANTAILRGGDLSHGLLVKDIDVDANYTVSASTAPPEYANKVLKFTDTGAILTAARNVVIPAVDWVYLVENDTNYTLTVGVSGGTGFAVPAKAVAVVVCDGTDCTGRFLNRVEIPVDIGDETTAITTGTAKKTFRLPAMRLADVRASVTTAPTDAAIQIDLNDDATSVFSTVLSIDSTEKTSTTAATPAVIANPDIADDSEMTVDIDQIGSTVAGAGVKLLLIGYRTS